MAKKVEIDGESVYMKKNWLLGWGVIHPIKNEDGTINWKNLIAGGSWFKLFILGVIIAIILGAIHEYSTAVQVANDCLNKTPQIIFP